MTVLMPAARLVAGLEAALNRKDGYIMGATGQNPRKWSVNSWWFTQYKGAQRTKALYWRDHAARVWDCQGLAEGIYMDHTGVNVNTKARYNFANWCGIKGSGMIPAKRRVPGAAVFWGDKASTIHHVAYLYKPVDEGNPEGDWYLIEARGVMYGVVKTRLNARKPNFWGLMDKYFNYGDSAANPAIILPDHTLRRGDTGADVVNLQRALILAGYKLPKYGADGDFGKETEKAVNAFKKAHGLKVDGICGKKVIAALKRELGI